MNKPNLSIPVWIRNCWQTHQSKILDGHCAVEWTDAMEEWSRCWCCGLEQGKRLQQCHIVAKSIGGTKEAKNIVPLCRHCHDKMPDTPDPDNFWSWIKEQQNPLCGIGLGRYWPLQQAIEKALKGKDLSEVDHAEFTETLSNYLKQTSMHGSQSGKGIEMKLSSMEWAVLSAVKTLPDMPPA